MTPSSAAPTALVSRTAVPLHVTSRERTIIAVLAALLILGFIGLAVL